MVILELVENTDIDYEFMKCIFVFQVSIRFLVGFKCYRNIYYPVSLVIFQVFEIILV